MTKPSPTAIDFSQPVLALAPMQDITDLPFWKLIASFGGSDLYFTEYFRVHQCSRLDTDLLRCLTENPTGKPVVAQIAGHHIPSLIRTAKALQAYPIAAVDLNLGCPAPVVCRKNTGGGLLRNLETVERILGALRENITIRLSVKCRLGWDSIHSFEDLLSIFQRHAVDLVTVHGRTVRQNYGGEVRYDLIALAAARLPCPVLANGDIDTAEKALAVLHQTKAAGIMIGRGAIRNPWIFKQIRQLLSHRPVEYPTGGEVRFFLQQLFEAIGPARIHPRAHIEKLKKYLNFIGMAIDPSGTFLHRAQRLASETEFNTLLDDFLAHSHPMKLAPSI